MKSRNRDTADLLTTHSTVATNLFLLTTSMQSLFAESFNKLQDFYICTNYFKVSSQQ